MGLCREFPCLSFRVIITYYTYTSNPSIPARMAAGGCIYNLQHLFSNHPEAPSVGGPYTWDCQKGLSTDELQFQFLKGWLYNDYIGDYLGDYLGDYERKYHREIL